MDLQTLVSELPEEARAEFIRGVALAHYLTPFFMNLLKDAEEQPDETSIKFGIAMGVFAASGNLDLAIERFRNSEQSIQ